jgi:hypothetical protein
MSQWKDQFERVSRALKKVEQPSGDRDAELDDLYGFFQACWHLKDWIKNDDSLQQDLRDAIVHAVEATESLQFCADLANGSKHLKLKREIKGANLWHVESLKNIDAKTGEVIFSVKIGYMVASKHGIPTPSDVIGFSRKVVQGLERPVAQHGLKT